MERIKKRGKVLALLFFVLANSMAVYANTNPPPGNAYSGILLKADPEKQAIQLPVKIVDGQDWIVLRQAVEYLGGTTSWHEITRKVIIKGPEGRQAVLTADMPRLVVERRRLIRLPNLPQIYQGNVWVSPQTLAVIWQQIGGRDATYDADRRMISVGNDWNDRKADETQSQNEDTYEVVPPKLKNEIVVVVDAGHGGRDPGAIGPTKLQEKKVTLEIAEQLAYYLRKKGIKVVMTRKSDCYISLKERADIANQIKADLFVSIHANASRNRKANGSQVFIYNREASSRHAAEAAKLENQDANYLEIIKDDLRQSTHEVSSVNAAGFVSQQLEKLKLDVKRIERAPFYVLAKSHMPSILVETAFISNYKEEGRLRSRSFCINLAQGIYQGVTDYYNETVARK